MKNSVRRRLAVAAAAIVPLASACAPTNNSSIRCAPGVPSGQVGGSVSSSNSAYFLALRTAGSSTVQVETQGYKPSPVSGKTLKGLASRNVNGVAGYTFELDPGQKAIVTQIGSPKSKFAVTAQPNGILVRVANSKGAATANSLESFNGAGIVSSGDGIMNPDRDFDNTSPWTLVSNPRRLGTGTPRPNGQMRGVTNGLPLRGNLKSPSGAYTCDIVIS